MTDTSDSLVFLGQARPGSTHDLTSAHADGIIEAVSAADVETAADSGYQGASGTVRTPVKHPRRKGHNSLEKQANSAHAKPRTPVEQALAVLKRWRVLDTVHISPNRITTLLHALLTIINAVALEILRRWQPPSEQQERDSW
ncbi:transposase family protein [Streptomyces noursei]|uniref:transposase family protein n=1 Tax=Streptomyces noursei TaxID=1971 RepID=UPI003B968D76